jgi:hypothetical protein
VDTVDITCDSPLPAMLLTALALLFASVAQATPLAKRDFGPLTIFQPPSTYTAPRVMYGRHVLLNDVGWWVWRLALTAGAGDAVEHVGELRLDPTAVSPDIPLDRPRLYVVQDLRDPGVVERCLSCLSD